MFDVFQTPYLASRDPRSPSKVEFVTRKDEEEGVNTTRIALDQRRYWRSGIIYAANSVSIRYQCQSIFPVVIPGFTTFLFR